MWTRRTKSRPGALIHHNTAHMHESTSHHSTALHSATRCGRRNAQTIRTWKKLGFHWPKAVCVFLQAVSLPAQPSQTMPCCHGPVQSIACDIWIQVRSVSMKASKLFTLAIGLSTKSHLNCSILLAAPHIHTKLILQGQFLPSSWFGSFPSSQAQLSLKFVDTVVGWDKPLCGAESNTLTALFSC
jgi:hypothetical protein